MKHLLSFLVLLGSGCASTTTTVFEVELRGTFVLADGVGDVEVQLHHAEQGEGVLAHPLGEIERFDTTLDAGIEHTFLYPLDAGTGLVVHAWNDADGDGALCAPDGDTAEASGLVEVSDFPAHEVEVTIVLDAQCEGPEGLFP